MEVLQNLPVEENIVPKDNENLSAWVGSDTALWRLETSVLLSEYILFLS